MPAIICPHCGVTNRAYSNFCNNCGADLRALPIDPSKRTVDPPGEPSDADVAPRIRQDRDLPSADEIAVDEDVQDSEQEGNAEEIDEFIAPLPEEGKLVQQATTRLVTGLQGLLDPHSIALGLSEDNTPPLKASESPDPTPDSATKLPPGLETAVTSPTIPEVPADQLEDLRAVMSLDPQLENSIIPLSKEIDSETVRMPLLFSVLLTVMVAVIGLPFQGPIGTVRPLPGVTESYRIIDGLSPRSNILVLWAYDPATAGEMDGVALPIMHHLFEKEGQLAVISTLPTGPATARQLWNEISLDYSDTNRTALIDLGYLPGGSAAMPIMGYTDVQGILRYGVREYGAGSSFVQFWQKKPDLMLVLASQVEDVQIWLEQVQPLNGVQTIAIASAGADPALRPYWNSRQLGGLVSGFDGATAYQQLRQNGDNSRLTANSTLQLAERDYGVHLLIAQNWGHILLIGLVLLGNLSILLRRQ
ncbi:MAG: zinc ribbon domain-containing protein [Chloroflexota bacterium]